MYDNCSKTQYGNISSFSPLNVGIGDIYVVARMGNQYQATGFKMTVMNRSAGDTDNDGDVDISDLSTLLANFGSRT